MIVFVKSVFIIVLLSWRTPDYISDKGTPVIVNPGNCGQEVLALRVRVENIKKIRGQVVLDLHGDIVSDFLEDDKVILRVRQDVNDNEMNICVPLENPGNYAIGAYHDKNSNHKFDKNILGLPKERFGISGNPKYKRKKPHLRDCIIRVTPTGTDITIYLVSPSRAL